MLSRILLIILFYQADPPLKPASQFEIITNYQLKRKPTADNPIVVFDQPDDKKESGADLLPYLAIQLKVKRWHPSAELVKVIDGQNKTYLRKKVNDSGVYDWDIGYVDDVKDGVTSGEFFIHFLEGKKIIEMITITIEPDGTFLVNGEKRGKF